MNIQLQQIIEEMKVELERRNFILNTNKLRQNAYDHARGSIASLSNYIPKLEKILNEGSVAATPEDGIYKEIKGLGNVRMSE